VTAEFLSQEWLDEVRERAEAEPERPGVTAKLQVSISGTPTGEVRSYWVVEDGRLRDAQLGVLPEPDLELTVQYADALAIRRGELDANVAYMRGRLKAAGDTGKLLRLLQHAHLWTP